MKIYRKISVLAMAALVLAAGFTSCSEDSLDTNQYNKNGVNLLGFGPMPITRGATMRITGTKLNEVQEVLFPEGNQKLTPSTTTIKGDFTLQSSQELSVTVPDMCVPGKLRMLTKSGDTIESKTFITFAEEIKASTLDPNPVHPGGVLSIKGEYMWNIGQVIFFDHVVVDAEDFLLNTRHEIQVRVPMEAKSGDVAYNDGSEGAENIVIGHLDVDAVKATGVSNPTPEFGEEITITGENFDLVTTIDFPAVADVTDFTVAEDGKSLKVKVPVNCVSGQVVLNSLSGLTSSVDITVPLATVSSTAPTKDVKAGQTITIKGDKLDRITHLVRPAIDAIFTDFKKSATEISFVVPEGMGDGKVVLVQHANYSVESDKISMYSEAPEVSIWAGKFEIGNWNAGMQELAWGGYDWSQVSAGTTLKLYYEVDASVGYINIRFGNGSWAALPSTQSWGSDGNASPDPSETSIKTVLTADDLDQLNNAGGLVICGAGIICKKVVLQ